MDGDEELKLNKYEVGAALVALAFFVALTLIWAMA